jgi:hypothetical protein
VIVYYKERGNINLIKIGINKLGVRTSDERSE